MNIPNLWVGNDTVMTPLQVNSQKTNGRTITVKKLGGASLKASANSIHTTSFGLQVFISLIKERQQLLVVLGGAAAQRLPGWYGTIRKLNFMDAVMMHLR